MANNMNFGDRFARALSMQRVANDPQYMLGAAIGAGLRSLYDGYQERGKAKKADEGYKEEMSKINRQDSSQSSPQNLSDMAIFKDPAELIKASGLPEGTTMEDLRTPGIVPDGMVYQPAAQPTPGLLGNQASNIAANMAQGAQAEYQRAQAIPGMLAEKRAQQVNETNQAVQKAAEQEAQKERNALKLAMAVIPGAGAAEAAGAEAAAGAAAEAVGEEAMKKAAEQATTDAMKNMGVSSLQQYALDNNPYFRRSFQQGASQQPTSFEEAPELLPNLTSAERRGLSEVMQMKKSWQYFKDMYDNAEDEETAQKAQEGMAAVARQTNNLRNNYAKAGVNLDRLAGAQATLEDVSNRIQQDTIRKYNDFTSGDNFMSSDQFYYRMVDRLRAKGMSPADAERFAKQYATRYQADLIARQSNALRDLGMDGNTVNQLGAMLIANMARENPQYANTYLQQFMSPKEVQQFQNQRAAAEHNAQLQQALAQWKLDNGVGRGGRTSSTTASATVPDPLTNAGYGGEDGYSYSDWYNSLNFLSGDDRDKQLNAKLGQVERLQKMAYKEEVGLDGKVTKTVKNNKHLQDLYAAEQDYAILRHKLEIPPKNLKELWSKGTTMQELEADDGNPLFSDSELHDWAYQAALRMQNGGVDLDGKTPEEIANDLASRKQTIGNEK